jgi:tRNA/tmRNA/rRNA uracil-C5-methylase (TrmA/RlmC/RlmD family)
MKKLKLVIAKERVEEIQERVCHECKHKKDCVGCKWQLRSYPKRLPNHTSTDRAVDCFLREEVE